MEGDVRQGSRQPPIGQVPRRHGQLQRQRHPPADLDMRRNRQPEMDRPLGL